MRTALVHDYLLRFGGAEQVLKSFQRIFPLSPIYTILYDAKKLRTFFPETEIKTSFLENFPFFKREPKYLLPFLPVAVEGFDLGNFDLILSSSSAFAKGIISRPSATHICYCHSPTRFCWDWTHNYLQEQSGARGWNLFKKMPAKVILHYLRLWDRTAVSRVDYFIANSRTVQKRIWKYYRRKSTVIYPPVDMPDVRFGMSDSRQKKGYFLIVSQLRPYKRIDLAVEAFNRLGLPLIVIGEGVSREHLERRAEPNIKFLGWQRREIVNRYYENSLAFILPGEEDFGIAPVEAMSWGKPVLAYKKGGATETVKEGISGMFFDEASVEGLIEGAKKMREYALDYNPLEIRRLAEKFSRGIFEEKLKRFIQKKLAPLENYFLNGVNLQS